MAVQGAARRSANRRRSGGVAATAPTRVLHRQSDFAATGTSKSLASTFDVTNGDLIVIIGHNTWHDQTLATPTWTGTGTVTLRASVVGQNDRPSTYLWTIAVTATATARNITVTSTAYQEWGFTATVWRNHGGLGNYNSAFEGGTSGVPLVNLSVAAKSAVEVGVGDTEAIDGATRTWRTVNGSAMTEQLYFHSVNYTVYGGHRLDVGSSAGTAGGGLTVPTGQKWSAVAAEIRGSGGAPPPPPDPPPSGGGTWLSGAAGPEAADGSYGVWRNRAVQIGQTWMNSSSLPNLQPGAEWGNWTGPMEVSLVAPDFVSWASEAAGGHDAYWTTTFANLATLRAGRGTTYARIYYEYNGTWMAYTVNSGQEANFRAAWNRIANIARIQFPAVKMILGAAAANGLSVASAWPTATVDALSIDFYNNWPFTTTQAGFNDKIENAAGVNSLDDLRRLAESKGVPICISEWGNQGKVQSSSTGGGGESPGFMDAMHAWCVDHAGTGPGQLLYEIYFNLWDDQFTIFTGPTANPLQPNTAAQYKLSTRFGG